MANSNETESMKATLPRAFYSAEDFGAMLGLSRAQIYERIRGESIPATKVGGRWMVPVWYIEELMTAGTTPPEPAAA